MTISCFVRRSKQIEILLYYDSMKFCLLPTTGTDPLSPDFPRSEISDNGIAPAGDRVFPGCIRTQTGTCFDNQVDFVISE